MTDLTPNNRFRLGDLKASGDRVTEPLPVLMGFNLGNRTVNISMAMEKFRELSEVANEARIVEMTADKALIAQRPLDEKHARSIGLYILRGFLHSLKERWETEHRDIPEEMDALLLELGAGPYQGLQPITGNIRECEPGGADLEFEKTGDGRFILHLRQGQVIWVIDGQHRRFGYGLLIDWLREITTRGRYVKRAAIFIPAERDGDDLEFQAAEMAIWAGALEEAKSRCTVDVTVHLGLTAGQERQLFHDLNNLGKKPDASIAQSFDQANPVSIFVRKEIEAANILSNAIRIADEGSKKNQKRAPLEVEDHTIYRDDLAVCNAILFAGSWNQAGIPASRVNPYYDYAKRFWSAIGKQPDFGAPGWFQKTLLAQPVMLKALAQLAFTFHGSREANSNHLDRFMTALENDEINFSHKNDLWKVYFLQAEELTEHYPGIQKYLTPVVAMQPFGIIEPETELLRFGAASRDVSRYIGDLIRWKLELPYRPALQALVKKLVNAERLPQDAMKIYELSLEDLL